MRPRRQATILTVVVLLCLPSFALPKIYVDSMGRTDDAERFRMLVRNELERLQVPTVDNAEQADATLTGILAIKVDDRGHATVELRDKKGARVWGADVAPGVWARYDELNTRAKKVARELRKALDKMAPQL